VRELADAHDAAKAAAEALMAEWEAAQADLDG
jgi:hypothetical protein